MSACSQHGHSGQDAGSQERAQQQCADGDAATQPREAYSFSVMNRGTVVVSGHDELPLRRGSEKPTMHTAGMRLDRQGQAFARPAHNGNEVKGAPQ